MHETVIHIGAQTPDTTANEWTQILEEIRPGLPAREFEAWFEPTSFLKLVQGTLYVCVPKGVHRRRIIHRYTEQVVHAVRSLKLPISKIELLEDV